MPRMCLEDHQIDFLQFHTSLFAQIISKLPITHACGFKHDHYLDAKKENPRVVSFRISGSEPLDESS